MAKRPITIFGMAHFPTTTAGFLMPIVPLFTAGGVRFFETPSASPCVNSGERFDSENAVGGYLVSNERHFSSYFPEIRNIGGTVLGIGSLQNLSLAVAARANGLMIADISPKVLLTLSLLLPQIPASRGPDEFAGRAMALVDPEADEASFLDPVSDSFHPALSSHLEYLRANQFYRKTMRRLLGNLMSEPNSFLGDRSNFEAAADLIERGGVSLLYGNFFSDEMPDLIDAAMSAYPDPLRVVHTTNALEQMAQRRYPISYRGLLKILEGRRTDPNGRFLLSTEFSPIDEIRREKRRMGDAFTYHAVPIRAAETLLRTDGTVPSFLRRFESDPGLTALPRSA